MLRNRPEPQYEATGYLVLLLILSLGVIGFFMAALWILTAC